MEHQFLIGTFHLEKQDFLLDILLLPKIFHWNDEKSHVSYFTMSFQQDFSEAFCKWWTTSDSLSSLQSMAGACSSFLKKIVRNKGLKTALHVGDLVEFCHTLQTGSSPSQSSPAAKSMWRVLFTSIFFCLYVLFTQDAVVIILDVSPSMCQAAPGHATSLETSVKAINMIIQRKVRKFCLTSPRAPGHLVWSK